MRVIVLGFLVATGALIIDGRAASAGRTASADGRRNRQAERQPVRHEGWRRNSSVFITAKGVIVVDTKNPGWGQPLLDAIKK